MKLLWPSGVYRESDGRMQPLFTYSACTSMEEVDKVFATWRDEYGYDIQSAWVDIVSKDGKTIREEYPIEKETPGRHAYRVAFVDGYDNHYKVYDCRADSLEAAVRQTLEHYGAGFDHSVKSVTEDGVLVLER